MDRRGDERDMIACEDGGAEVQVAAAQDESGDVLGLEDVSERIREGDDTRNRHILRKEKKTKKTMKTEKRVRLADVEDEGFSEDLIQELNYDNHQVEEEYQHVWQMTPSKLGQWGFLHLDQDGKATRIQEWLKKGFDIFTLKDGCVEAWEKYKHLALDGCKPQFLKSALDMREDRWLDWESHVWKIEQPSDLGNDMLDISSEDGCAEAWENRDTKEIGRHLKGGEDIFTGYYGAAEAWEKHKHLAPEGYKRAFLKGSLAVWKIVYLGENGDTKTSEQYLKEGDYFFTDVEGDAEAWQKYKHSDPIYYIRSLFANDENMDEKKQP